MVQCGAVWCSVRCSAVQCIAVCCSVLRCVVVCCGVLQCVAVCCSVVWCAYLSIQGMQVALHIYIYTQKSPIPRQKSLIHVLWKEEAQNICKRVLYIYKRALNIGKRASKQKEFWESAEAGKSRIHFVDWKFCECSFTQIFYECIFAGSSKFLVQAYLTNFYEEAYLYKFHQQNVWIILLNYAFPHCGLGRCLVGSEGFLKILSPHPYVGSVGFFYKSIVPTVEGEELLYICKKSLMYLQKSLIRAVWECEWPWNVTWPVCVCIYIYILYIYIYYIYIHEKVP